MRVDSLLSILFFLAVIAFSITTIVLFIIDCVRAKKAGRRVKTVFKVLFIIGLVILTLTAAFFGFLMLLAVAVANHM